MWPNLSTPTMAGVVTLVTILWVIGLWRFGAGLDPEVAIWRRTAGLRGFDVGVPFGERLEGRLPVLAHLRAFGDLRRQMLLAGRYDETLEGYLLSRAGFGLGVAGLLGLLDLEAVATGQSGPVAPGLAIVVGVVIFAAGVLDVLSRARRRRRAIDHAVAEIPALLAILVSARGMSMNDAIRFLAACLREPTLREVLDEGRWRRLVAATPAAAKQLALAGPQPNPGTVYLIVGLATGSNNLRELGHAIHRILLGGESTRTVCLDLARRMQDVRLHEVELLVARAERLVVVPQVGMLLAVFAVLGPALFFNAMRAF